MNPIPFPTVAAAVPLPTASPAPRPIPVAREAPPDSAIEEAETPSTPDFTQQISAGISRAVRQRRYTR